MIITEVERLIWIKNRIEELKLLSTDLDLLRDRVKINNTEHYQIIEAIKKVDQEIISLTLEKTKIILSRDKNDPRNTD